MLLTDTLPCMAGKSETTSDKKLNVSCRLDPKVLAELQDIAREDERTVSFLLEKGAKLYIESRRGHKPPKR